jgi:hypothetical protein
MLAVERPERGKTNPVKSNQVMEVTAESAKQFLLSKLTEQASIDGVALDDVEKRMFLFSESSGNPDFEVQEKFDADYSARTYESKISKLLRRSYSHDKRTEDGRASWRAALRALSREDFYGLVMVDQAKIPRVNTALWVFLLGMLPLALTEALVVGIGFIVVFQPLVFRLRLPDWFRLLLLPFFFWLFWYVGRVFGRIEMVKPTKQTESKQS